MTTLEILGIISIPTVIVSLVVLIGICCSETDGIIITEKELKRNVTSIVIDTLNYINTVEKRNNEEITYGEITDYIKIKTHMLYSELENEEH